MSCVALSFFKKKNNYKQEHFVSLEIVVYCVGREGGRGPVSPAAGALLHLGSRDRPNAGWRKPDCWIMEASGISVCLSSQTLWDTACKS